MRFATDQDKKAEGIKPENSRFYKFNIQQRNKNRTFSNRDKGALFKPKSKGEFSKEKFNRKAFVDDQKAPKDTVVQADKRK